MKWGVEKARVQEKTTEAKLIHVFIQCKLSLSLIRYLLLSSNQRVYPFSQNKFKNHAKQTKTLSSLFTRTHRAPTGPTINPLSLLYPHISHSHEK